MKTKTFFIGSGVFAVEILKGLLGSPDVELMGIVTQPDKPAGRKKIITPCPVGEYIQKAGLSSAVKIFKPEKLKLDVDSIINETKPELVIVTDYGQFIPESIINYPKFKCLNVHGSLLPDLRGAVPIPMAILQGYKKTGVSIPIMTPKMDDGDIIASAPIDIMPDDTAESLKARMAVLGSKLLVKIIPDWVAGEIRAVSQDSSKATFCWMKDIAKEKAQILPDTTAVDADKMVRGFYPWPVAWCKITDGKTSPRLLKLFKVELIENEPSINLIGFKKEGNDLFLYTKEGKLKILRLQIEGKKITNGSSSGFLDGQRLVV